MFFPDGNGGVRKNIHSFAVAETDLHELIYRQSFDQIARRIGNLLLDHGSVELQSPLIVVDTQRTYGKDRLRLNEGVANIGWALDQFEAIKDVTVFMGHAPYQAIQQFELTNGNYIWTQGPTYRTDELPSSALVSPLPLLRQQQDQMELATEQAA